jgi:hypothetical protein
MNAKLTIEKITPKRATELLSNLFEGQRNQRDSYINSLATEMKEGRWRLSCDAILIVKGKLANGQHRLCSVIKSNASCPFIVMETNDDELYKVIDAGQKRTIGDVIKLVDNANSVASIGSLIVKYKSNQLSAANEGNFQRNGSSRSVTIEFIEKNLEQISECAKFVLELYRQKKIMPVSHAGALFFLGSEKNKTRTEDFVRSVFLGTSRDDAAWTYREKLLEEMRSKRKLPKPTMFALGIKSLRSALNGTCPDILKLQSNEPFPKL